jgi:hypothetical protein
LIIVLSVLQVMASDYPFGIFKLLVIVLFVLLQVMACTKNMLFYYRNPTLYIFYAIA